jgi:23S rRNA (adenine2503-C2)-methyltransferase
MTSLPLSWRQELAAGHPVMTAADVRDYPSADGATRFLITLADGKLTECVLMPYADRTTVCLSSMVGCPAACVFCATGALGFGRNLSAGEILEQLLICARASSQAPGTISNIVFMGMGEPLLNYAEFMASVRTMVHAEGLAYSPRRITVSTVGLPEGILRLAGEDLPLRLAISLHAPDDETRRELMPVAHRHDVADIMAAAREYFARTRRRISFEYTLIAGVNDRLAQADLLARRVAGIVAHVNLIPFNEWPGSPLRRPRPDAVQAFVARLRNRGVNATVRHSRGQDAGAACGQLAAGGALAETPPDGPAERPARRPRTALQARRGRL